MSSHAGSLRAHYSGLCPDDFQISPEKDETWKPLWPTCFSAWLLAQQGSSTYILVEFLCFGFCLLPLVLLLGTTQGTLDPSNVSLEARESWCFANGFEYLLLLMLIWRTVELQSNLVLKVVEVPQSPENKIHFSWGKNWLSGEIFIVIGNFGMVEFEHMSTLWANLVFMHVWS